MLQVDEVGGEIEKDLLSALNCRGDKIIFFHDITPSLRRISSAQFLKISELEAYFKINFRESLLIRWGALISKLI